MLSDMSFPKGKNHLPTWLTLGIATWLKTNDRYGTQVGNVPRLHLGGTVPGPLGELGCNGPNITLWQ